MRRRLFAITLVVAPPLVAACLSSEESPPAIGGLDASLDVIALDTTIPPRTDTGTDASAPPDTSPDVNANADAGADANASADADANAVADANADADANAVADANADADADADAAAVADAGPTLLATGFGRVLSVLADDTDIYFTTYGTTDAGTYDQDGTVVRCPIAGGCAASTTILASGLNNPAFIALDADHLYIGAAGSVGSGKFDGYVYSCPRAGCGANDVDRITITPGLQNLGGITQGAGYVYFVQNPLGNTCGRALADGGDFKWLGNANGYSSEGVTVDDANAYWTHTYYPPAIHVAPFNGDGGRVLVDIAPVDGGLSPQNLTYDDGWLYYVSPLNNEVNRVHTDGGGLETLAAGMSGPYWMALDSTDVYSADYYAPNTIRRISKDGGGAVPVATPNKQLTGVAVNSSSFFWCTYDGQVWQELK